MELSLGHIAMLLELVQKEVSGLKLVIDNPKSSDDEVDDSGELVIQNMALESILVSMYKSKWTSDSGYPKYEEE